MKNIFLIIIMCLAANISFSQIRQCGTMDYLEVRKQQDPSLEKRMDDAEKEISKWSNMHPVASVSSVMFPSLPGFIPSGNEANDRNAYANAKQMFLLEHPAQKIKSLTSDGYFLRENKRKHNSFITK